MNNITRYSQVQRKLHWGVVILVACQYVLQVPMRNAMSRLHDNLQVSALDFLVTTLHTWGGAAIGAIMVYRLVLRVKKPVPVGAGTLRGAQQLIAVGLHWFFYVMLFFMVLTGTVQYYFDVQWLAYWHERGEWVLLGLIAIHILAAMLHRWYKNDAVLGQMWGSRPPH